MLLIALGAAPMADAVPAVPPAGPLIGPAVVMPFCVPVGCVGSVTV